MILNKNDIIEHSSYWYLPNITRWGNWKGQQLYDAPPDGARVVLTIDDAKRFFEMWGNCGRRYTLISSSSDFSLALQSEYPYWKDALTTAAFIYQQNPNRKIDLNLAAREFIGDNCNILDKYVVRSYNKTWYSFPEIPDNITHWFMTHPLVKDERISVIPFGITEGGRDDLWTVMNENHQKRPDSIYANFSIDSNPIDREVMLEQCKIWKSKGIDVTIAPGNMPRIDYYRALAQHQWAAAPWGNGRDSYRIWESLYLKTAPIINQFEGWSYDLLYPMAEPLNMVDNFTAGTFDYIYKTYVGEYLDRHGIILELSYWEECFHES